MEICQSQTHLISLAAIPVLKAGEEHPRVGVQGRLGIMELGCCSGISAVY